MSAPGTEHPLDDVAAYAVGALDEVEARLVEAHLAVCGHCRAELVAHHEALARLTPDEPAPPAVWARIVASFPADAGPAATRPAEAPRPDRRPAPPPPPAPAAGASPGPDAAPTPPPPARPARPAPPAPAAGEAPVPEAGLTPAPPTSSAPTPSGKREGAAPPGDGRYRRRGRAAGGPAHLRGRPRRRTAARVLQAAAALVVVAGLAVGATLALTAGDDGGGGDGSDRGVAGPPPSAAPAPGVDELARAALEDPRALAVLAGGSDSGGTGGGQGGRPVARLVRADAGTFVVLDELPPLPTGRAYQLWSVDGAAPVSLGVLGNGERTAVAVAVPEATRTVAISDAPAGGEVAPTGPIVALGEVRPA